MDGLIGTEKNHHYDELLFLRLPIDWPLEMCHQSIPRAAREDSELIILLFRSSRLRWTVKIRPWQMMAISYTLPDSFDCQFRYPAVTF